MMRTFATRLLGLVFLSSLGGCFIEPVGGYYGGRYDDACYEVAAGPACVRPSGAVYLGGGWRSPGPLSPYRTHGFPHPPAANHGPGHPVSHGGGHGGSAASHSGGSHGGHR